MSNREGFTSGLMIGATLGSMIGGVLGVVLASRMSNDNSSNQLLEAKKTKKKSPQHDAENIEIARLSLEDKIAQLNQAIDDVRQQLGSVNGNVTPENSESLQEDA
ncbi:membrane protein [Limnoraphis robusta]|uniref:Membrane protein n=1 Tax=Limnoraphis robusta CS-951 TaxID=1637645 RepID=A0A0F5YB68_9CYAN|nr:membrane protein [Limnoraphis robusta]KKD35857.1 membrane protein [Limnoraphis robusta CS-951]